MHGKLIAGWKAKPGYSKVGEKKHYGWIASLKKQKQIKSFLIDKHGCYALPERPCLQSGVRLERSGNKFCTLSYLQRVCPTNFVAFFITQYFAAENLAPNT